MDIILREEFDDFILATLSDLISKHHESYINIFKDTLKPKHHFMVHYPTVIKLLGPLKHLWSFRFESKHQMSKQYCHIIASRKNVPLSLTIKHSIQFSNTLITNSFFKSDAKNFKNISKTDLTQLDFYKNLTTNFKRVFKVKSLIYRGILFEENCYVKMQKKVFKILLIFYDKKEKIFLVLQEIKVLFLEKYQAYKIENPYNSYEIQNINNFLNTSREITLNNFDKVLRF